MFLPQSTEQKSKRIVFAQYAFNMLCPFTTTSPKRHEGILIVYCRQIRTRRTFICEWQCFVSFVCATAVPPVHSSRARVVLAATFHYSEESAIWKLVEYQQGWKTRGHWDTYQEKTFVALLFYFLSLCAKSIVGRQFP